jgi:alginate O-acetyltransferase complex protein AlgI
MEPSTQLFLYVLVVPVAWLIYVVAKGSRARQGLLLFVSYFLYASWSLWFVGILLTSSLMNYALGILIRRRQTAMRLWFGIILNLLLLGTFKYLPEISPLIPLGIHLRVVLANIVLPVGISFWTFQALSYLFDLYRGEVLNPSVLEFLLYMAFWPTVLSGPVCRLSNLLPQFRKTSNPRLEDIRHGFDRICIGLLMIVLGQTLANGVRPGQGLDEGFSRVASRWAGSDAWCLAIGYGFELFFNFAGYSHIVIGGARLFGIHLDENFARPYFATSPSEFWTRWHMSLSFWIRDYLFLPLAMMRRERWWRSVALVLSMVIFGLWHKGTVLYALWGCYHGVLLVLHRQWQQFRRNSQWKLSGGLTNFLSWLITFFAICLGWILFRANDATQALTMLRAAFSLRGYLDSVLPFSLYILVIASVGGYFGVLGAGQFIRKHAGEFVWPLELRVALYSAVFYMGLLHTGQTQTFIYFQF